MDLQPTTRRRYDGNANPVNPYRCRVLQEMGSVLGRLQLPLAGALDVGAGDGWFAKSFEGMGICEGVTAVDVMQRPSTFHRIVLYDGVHLPFADFEFDLVYAVDVIHHAIEPLNLLPEMARCAKRYLLIKDHTWQTRAQWLALAAMDEIGNRRFGVRSIYNFQFEWDWDAVLRGAGFKPAEHVHPLVCHVGLLGRLTNKLQYLSVWERADLP